MEKLSRVTGLKMLAIKEGTECGKIRHVVINPDLKSVCYYALDTGEGFFGYKLLPTQLATSMGADFATTMTNSSLINFWEEPDALAIAFTDTELIGADVITNDGDVIGKIKDFEFCPKEGTIDRYFMVDGRIISKDSAVTMARGILFIDSMPESAPTEAAEVLPFDETAMEEPAGEVPAANDPIAVETEQPVAEEETIAEDEHTVEEPTPAEAESPKEEELIAIKEDDEPVNEVTEEVAAPRSKTEKSRSASSMNAAQRLAAAKAAMERPEPESEPEESGDMKGYFEKRRTEFLIGRSVKADILASDGSVLAEKGTVVTSELIEAIREADRLIDLTMNVN